MSAAVAATPTLYIEYCTNCGLAQQFSSLKAALAKANVDVDLVANQAPPRMKTFEVIAEDGTVLYSKLESGCLPNMPQLVSRIQSHLAATASVGLEEAARRQRLRRRQLLAASLSIGVIVAAVGAWGWRTRQAQQQTARVQ